MTIQKKLHVPSGVQIWVNDGHLAPDWVAEAVQEERACNGSLLLRTQLGVARVHRGHVVIRHDDCLSCRSPEDLDEFLRGLKQEAAPVIAAIGPGKSAAYGSRSKLKRRNRKGETRKVAYRKPIGSMPSIEWVHVDLLAVDHTYQRSIDNEASRRLIASIAANFDWRLCAPLVVSRRPDGSKIIIDGQHRWAAALRRGDLLQLPCCLFTYDSPEDEARMFIVANRARKPMNRMDDFHAALAAADEDAAEIQRLVSEACLRVARSTATTALRPGEITFTSSIAAAIRRHGEGITSAALTCLGEAYDGQILTHGASVFGALVKVFVTPPEGFDPDNLPTALNRLSMDRVSDIVRGQVGGEARSAALVEKIVQLLDEAPETVA